jgi:hypothetical protein
MYRAKSNLSKAFLLTLLLGVGAVVCAPNDAEAQRIYWPPSPVFIATARPEYYGGRPVYWHHSNWYYHDDRGWNYYHSEPHYLHDRREGWGNRGRYRYNR